MHWVPHLRSWPNLRHQHDVSEFWGHLIERAYPHALAAETPFFTIQVKRYFFHDRAYKRVDPVQLRPDTVVNVPIFCTGQGADTYHVPYRLVFVIAHTATRHSPATTRPP